MDKGIYKEVSERANGSCENCKQYYGERLELHHILRRKVPATANNTIMLCISCHRGTRGIHGRDGHGLDIKLKLELSDRLQESGLDGEALKQALGGRYYW